MKKLNLAIAGTWHVHLPMFLNKTDEVYGDNINWMYVYDKNKERALPFCKRLEAEYTSDLDTILNDPSVDAVICESETCDHKDIIIKTAQAGKHIFTDKTLALSKNDAFAIKEAVEKSGVKFLVSHEVIPVASYQYVKKLIDDGIIGDVVSIHFRRAHGGAKPPSPDAKFKLVLPDDWFSREVAGGGSLIDLGIHGVALLAYLAGKPKKISAYTHNYTGHETEDSATIMVEFESGAIGTAHTNMVTSLMENNFEVLGTEGIITVQGNEGSETLLINSKKMPESDMKMLLVEPEKYRTEPTTPLCKFIDFVMDESNTNKYLDGLDIDSGITVVRMVEAAYESAATGKSVDF